MSYFYFHELGRTGRTSMRDHTPPEAPNCRCVIVPEPKRRKCPLCLHCTAPHDPDGCRVILGPNALDESPCQCRWKDTYYLTARKRRRIKRRQARKSLEMQGWYMAGIRRIEDPWESDASLRARILDSFKV